MAKTLKLTVKAQSWLAAKADAARTRAADRRAVSMLEYVLIAAVVVVLAGVFFKPLGNIFKGVITNITGLFSEPTTTTS
jgi:hypothetical protein